MIKIPHLPPKNLGLTPGFLRTFQDIFACFQGRTQGLSRIIHQVFYHDSQNIFDSFKNVRKYENN